jgi:hypothetical protein
MCNCVVVDVAAIATADVVSVATVVEQANAGSVAVYGRPFSHHSMRNIMAHNTVSNFFQCAINLKY